jgi:hypothetical protein
MSKAPKSKTGKGPKRLFIDAGHLWSQPDVILVDKEVIPPNYIDGGPVAGQGVNYNGIVYFSDFVPPYGNGDGDRQGDSVELRAVDLRLTLTNDTSEAQTWRVILGLLNENNTTATSSGIVADLCDGYQSTVASATFPLGFNAIKSQKYTILLDEVVDVPIVSASVFSQKTFVRKLDLGRRKCLCQFVPGVVTGTGMPFLFLINDFGGALISAPSATGVVRYHYVSV